jgi:hypothetical protein
MARVGEPVRPERLEPQNLEQSETCDHSKRVFGRPPATIRYLSQAGRHAGVCPVKWRGSFGNSFEFICAGGLLVGIPPKRRG